MLAAVKVSLSPAASAAMQRSSAADVAKAEEYAKNTLGIPNVSYRGVDVTTANEWNRGLYDTFNKFPELKSRFGFVGECQISL